MDSETDRVLADELRGILKKLRDENQELKDNDGAGSNLAWVIVAALIAGMLLMFCGSDGHHYHRY